ncbi:MAG TPA: hypothetical protein VGH56_05875 [Solirubrobacteraceae bacterium]
MTAKEQVIDEAPGWTEEQAQRALRAAHNNSPGEPGGEQPPLTCIGMFSSGRGDLSKLAADDVFEPEPSR